MIKKLDRLIASIDALLKADVTSDKVRKATIDGLTAYKDLLTEVLVKTVAKNVAGRIGKPNDSKHTRCRSCKHWDIESAKENGRVKSWRLAPCKYPLPILPTSFGITGQKPESTLNLMCANYGHGCPCYEKRVDS